MSKNLDVWTIQNCSEDLRTALSKINDGLNIVYSNCVCNFRLGNETITTRQFDTFLYNETSGILILIMRDGVVSKDDIIEYLEQNGKQYAEVTFEQLEDEYFNDDDILEIWIAKDNNVLKEALCDSVKKGSTSCIYYPNLDGELKLCYSTNDDEQMQLDARKFFGLVRLEDKIVLVVHYPYNIGEFGNPYNNDVEDIIIAINELGISCTVKVYRDQMSISEIITKKK